MAYEINVYLPGEAEPTDLDGYGAYLAATVALGDPSTLPDYVMLDLDNGRDQTEIRSTG